MGESNMDTSRGGLADESQLNMIRWIFRFVAIAFAGKLINRYLGSKPRDARVQR